MHVPGSVGRCRPLPVMLGLCAGLLAAETGMGGPPMNTPLARRYFNEARTISEADAGRLWGIELYGPLMFADPTARAVMANQADRKGKLSGEGGVFIGQLPENVNIANTSTRWSGTDWTMMVWPLPEDQADRAQLMAHEMWHRIQSAIGLTGSDPGNAHLDSMNGRLWLQLEWRALEAALRQSDRDSVEAVTDALVFRARRRSFFPDAAANESALEMHEGLAEYTGVRLAAQTKDQAVARAVRGLREGPSKPTFVRSFAYASGPAYGLLLDEANPTWRKGLSRDNDLGDLLRQALSVTIPSDLESAARSRSAGYDFETLHASETARESERQQHLAKLRAKFLDGPVLTIALRRMNIEFNPSNLIPLGEHGTVYPTARLSDVWGVLSVSDGVLLNPSWTEVVVPAPKTVDADPVIGDGWQLELAKGWTIVPDERPGCFRLKRGP